MPIQSSSGITTRSPLPGVKPPGQNTKLAALLTLLFAGPNVASALETTAEKHKNVVLGTVTVTANKIAEDLQRVPQSVTVLDGEEIDERDLKNVADVIEQIPNMTFVPDHGRSVNFRGLNTSMFTNNNPVVMYVDGVAVSSREEFDTKLVDVERIEVLRGPQGTLYGKDAIGAVINVISKDPGEIWSGRAGLEYGRFDRRESSVSFSGPLVSEQLYLGINGYYQGDDGWARNDLPGMNEDVGRARQSQFGGYLLYTPSERLRLRLTASTSREKLHLINEAGAPPGTAPGDFRRRDAEHIRLDVEPSDKLRRNHQSLQVRYQLDALTLESVTTHRTLTTDQLYDANFGDGSLYRGLTMFNDTEISSWSQELRVASNNEHGLRWVGGLYYETESRDQGPYGQQFPNFDPQTGSPLGNYEMNAVSAADTETRALFGQVMLPWGPEERFELTLGGRYQQIDKEIDLDMYYLPVGGNGPPMLNLKADKAWTAFLPRAALSWRLTDNWTTYISYAKGYMPGGFNYFAASGNVADNRFDPQTSDSYELGIKGSYRNLRLAASIFRMNIRDIHVYKAVGNMFLTDNAKKAHSQGAELELTWFPSERLELSSSLSVIDSEYDDYDAGNANYSGESIELTPSHSARLAATYRHPSGWYGRGEVRHTGPMHFYDGYRKSLPEADAYTIADLKVGYQTPHWDVYGYIKNLTDEEYITSFKSSFITAVAGFGEPRTFALGVRYLF